MINHVVVNGCSYHESYARGQGHLDLAQRLGFIDEHNIPQASSLAIGGSANSRILRTTLKHSYQALINDYLTNYIQQHKILE
jgi:hypothetical protein